ncbi:MAG: ComF family protein, partial [Bacteroidetes bacterium]|nr:ComF family protein [Bacteroidota bacterium]
MANSSISFGKDLAKSVFPHLCVGCELPKLLTKEQLCSSCTLQLPLFKWNSVTNNAAYDVFKGRLPFEGAFALMKFSKQGITQKIMHDIKYNGNKKLAFEMGQKLGKAMQNVEWNIPLAGIIPVPLHPKKEEKRGFNQAIELGKGLAQELEIPILSRAIERTRQTETQTKKNRIERIENLLGAFNSKKFKNNGNYLLIDDVLTTGA